MSTEPTYTCAAGANETCPETCVTLGNCDLCGCVVDDVGGGPWGKAADVILCLLPILFLLVVTLKPNPLPTTTSLPVAAVIMFLVRVMYLGSDPLLCSAAIISGLHEALSPITIMGGAIMLFETMEKTLCMPFIIREMKILSQGHVVSELMLLFCFAYMIEGASGFGTPVALGAPMLVSLGYPKFESVVTLLLMNTFATVWGAAGTPIWFGFGSLELSESEYLEVSYKSGVALGFGAYILMPFVMMYLCSWKRLRQNIVFFLLSLSTCVLPGVGISFVAYEFPSLIGGMIGCCLTALLIKFKIGLKDIIDDEDENGISASKLEEGLQKSSVTGDKEDSTTAKDETSGSTIKDTESEAKVPTAENGNTDDNMEKEESTVDEPTSKTDVNRSSASIAVDKSATSKTTDIDKSTHSSTSSVNKMTMVGTPKDSSRLHASQVPIEEKLGPRKAVGEGYIKEVIGRTFPLWGTVLILIVTRVPQIGLRDILTRLEPSFSIYLGTYGIFKCSASLVLQLENILTYPGVNWKYELLYVPFLIPFCLVAGITMLIYRKDLQCSPRQICSTVVGRLSSASIALFGALVLVQLLIREGAASPAFLIGSTLSEAFKAGWLAIAALIGALGSFFSGSTTISNLTFGEIQKIAADTIGISVTSMLGIQASGASAGNGVCLNNIIAACAVVGLNIGEGQVIGKTWKVVFGSCVITTVVMLAFFIRF